MIWHAFLSSEKRWGAVSVTKCTVYLALRGYIMGVLAAMQYMCRRAQLLSWYHVAMRACNAYKCENTGIYVLRV